MTRSNPKIITPLLWRVIVFLCLFLLISGAIGPRIISGGVLFKDGFGVYGGAGKALIFGLIAFMLLARHKKIQVTVSPWRPVLLGWIILSFVALVVAWICVNGLLVGDRQFGNLLGAHAGILLSIICAAIGCIGLKNIQVIWRHYSREIVSSAIIAAAFYLFLLVVYALWQPLASMVMFCVAGLLHVSGLHATLVPPNTLLFDKFGITVAEYCSGIESIALFSGLYAIVGLLDWNHLNRRRYFLVFPCALLLLCMLNVLRVYGLILAGYYINPDIAFSLFHTYAGIVFFILYSAIFWAVAYKHLVRKEEKNGHATT